MKVKDLLKRLKPYEDCDLVVSVVDLNTSQWDFGTVAGPLFEESEAPCQLLVAQDSVQLKTIIDTREADVW